MTDRTLRSRPASVLNTADPARDAQLNAYTAGDLLRLLETTYLLLRLPAWSENLNSRVAQRPKLHIANSGLAAHCSG